MILIIIITFLNNNEKALKELLPIVRPWNPLSKPKIVNGGVPGDLQSEKKINDRITAKKKVYLI